MLQSPPSLREAKVAKALVHPDKTIRDHTLHTVQDYLTQANTSPSSLTVEDCLKLWKALYYSLWLADKAPIQRELSEALVNLWDCLEPQQQSSTASSTSSNQAAFLLACCRILLREWSLLDKYRVNKFYSFFRLLIQKVFQLIQNHNWQNDYIQPLLQILQDEILHQRPDGLRYHLLDIYLEELWKVAGKTVTTSTFLSLLQPFLQDLLRLNDSIYRQRLIKSIFQKYLEQYAVENGKEEEVFVLVSTVALQKEIFLLASDPATPDLLRPSLYKLHKEFALKTGKLSVEDEEEEEVPKKEEEVVVVTKKEKKRKVQEVVEEEVPALVVVEEVVDKKKKKKKNAVAEAEVVKKEEVVEEEQKEEEVVVVEEEKPKKKQSKKNKKVPVEEEEEKVEVVQQPEEEVEEVTSSKKKQSKKKKTGATKA
eukprot:gene4024-4401_t